MVYHFTTTGIEQNCSSIQNVQRSRTECLNALNIPSKYIFCGFSRDIDVYSILSKQNFVIDDIIWMPAQLCNRKIEPSKYTIDMFKRDYGISHSEYVIDSAKHEYRNKKDQMKYRLVMNEFDCITYVDLYTQNTLVQRNNYMGLSLFYEEYRCNNQVTNRIFYDADHKVVYNQILHENNSGLASVTSYEFKDRVCVSNGDAIRYFIRKLNLTKDDLVIIDGVFDASVVSSCFKPAKVALQLQAHHHNDVNTDDDYISYSGYGSFFARYRDIDCVIAATQQQKADLDKQFAMTFDDPIKTYAIPVGCTDKLKYSKHRKKHSFVTAAKFQHVKRIDLVIRAIIAAHAIVPDITLDIYGTGDSWQRYYQHIIDECDANDYITFKGFCDMSDVYVDYDVHIMATFSEGFSLTTFESVIAGCAQIAFENVKYSTNEFISNGKNGFVAKLHQGMSDEERVESLTKAIVKYCSLKKTDSFHEASYNHAKRYLIEEVSKKWDQLLTEIMQ